MKQALAKTAVPADDAIRPGSHRLKSLTVIGGFLDGVTFDLAEGLNCIIGARGTGKTTVLEPVRFALDALPPRDGDADERRRIDSLIMQNLAGGRVELTIETKDGLTFVVTRSHGEDPIVLDADGQATELSGSNASGNWRSASVACGVASGTHKATFGRDPLPTRRPSTPNMFPSSHERGPIEASASNRAWALLARFYALPSGRERIETTDRSLPRGLSPNIPQISWVTLGHAGMRYSSGNCAKP